MGSDYSTDSQYSRHSAPTVHRNVQTGIGKNVVDNCLAGFNTCLFAYGQTGSGKTFTMIGVTEPPSTAPRTPLPSAAATKTAATATGAASTATAVTSAASEQKDIMRAFSSHAENISDAVMVGDECDRASSFGCATANGTGCRSGCNGNDGSLRPNPTTTMNRGLRSRDQRVVTSEASRTDGAPDTGAEPNLTASFVGMPETDVCTDLEYRRNDTSDVRGSGQAEKCDRGVIPRICDFLFERVASMTAGASASSSAAGLQEGGGVDEARGADSDRATKKRRGISTRWMFRSGKYSLSVSCFPVLDRYRALEVSTNPRAVAMGFDSVSLYFVPSWFRRLPLPIACHFSLRYQVSLCGHDNVVATGLMHSIDGWKKYELRE